jgi:hypothetical protein
MRIFKGLCAAAGAAALFATLSVPAGALSYFDTHVATFSVRSNASAAAYLTLQAKSTSSRVFVAGMAKGHYEYGVIVHRATSNQYIKMCSFDVVGATGRCDANKGNIGVLSDERVDAVLRTLDVKGATGAQLVARFS